MRWMSNSVHSFPTKSKGYRGVGKTVRRKPLLLMVLHIPEPELFSNVVLPRARLTTWRCSRWT